MGDTCTICGWPVRWVHVSKRANGRWVHERGRTSPGPRPWHHAAGPAQEEPDEHMEWMETGGHP